MAVGTKQKFVFRALFAECIPFKATVDFASIADGNEEASNITVPGAAIGDFVEVASGVDLSDLGLTASVTAADTVTVVAWNNTGGAVNLASQTITGVVKKPGDVFSQL